MDDLAISVKDVSKSFKLPHEKHSGLKQAVINFRPGRKFEKQKALQDISFDIKKGDFFGIVGRNGSGKSTLLKLLAQIYVPDEGSVTVNGTLTPFIELGVGFNPELTGRENVFLNGALLGFDRKQMNAMYDDIVEFAEIEKFMDQKLKNYSSGMQVRLAFSIAIRAQSDILLLDEVLAVGDTGFQQKCYKYFEELKSQNKTVVFVSHDMSAVTRFCNRAIYITGGNIKHEGTPSEVADIYLSDNIDNALNSVPGLSNAHKVEAKITDQTPSSLDLRVTFQSPDKDKMYVGISILKDGISVAEIITNSKMPLVGNGAVIYTLDTTILNAGIYQIAVALFKQENRQMIAIGRHKSDFTLPGHDETKGAAIKLADTWKRQDPS